MILYFSATGNSEHVARRIAAATDDKVVSIERFDAEALHLVATEGPVSWDLLPRCMPGVCRHR